MALFLSVFFWVLAVSGACNCDPCPLSCVVRAGCGRHLEKGLLGPKSMCLSSYTLLCILKDVSFLEPLLSIFKKKKKT